MLEAFESFVGVNFWTMIFAWCNLLILYLFLRKLLFKPVKNMIDSRQREIDDMNIFNANLSSWQAGVTTEQNIHLIVCLSLLLLAFVFLMVGLIRHCRRCK